MPYEPVDAHEWEAWVADTDAVVLDCREPAEWAAGTLPGSTLVSMNDVPEAIHAFEPSRPVLAVCRTGRRSAAVAAFLRANGFDRVGNLEGGLAALGLA
ncbi:MAG: rhodanese-like domain-containing protein [Acidimicrobiia bacterium]|nr:rhodanese-like domain-containing protein [Acidimicrobiia bacterium]